MRVRSSSGWCKHSWSDKIKYKLMVTGATLEMAGASVLRKKPVGPLQHIVSRPGHREQALGNRAGFSVM